MKGVWLTDDRYQVSAQIEKNADTHRAYFAIEDKAVESKGHEVAIGIDNGRPFLQVSNGAEMISVDLIEVARMASALKVVDTKHGD